MDTVKVGSVEFGNTKPGVLIGGVNVLESRDLALSVAETMKRQTLRHEISYVFKASFDKANRSSHKSYRGPGMEEGLRILQDVRDLLDVPVLTDVHLPEQARVVAEVCDMLQLPAFLARQTDLVAALAKTGKAVNVKKPQFMSPVQTKHIVEKFCEFGNSRVIISERGTCFGYDNLVVDMLGVSMMRDVNEGVPIILDVTHSLQFRKPGATTSGGRRDQLFELARAGLGVGLAGIFLEAHPDPENALCDGASAMPIEKLPSFLFQMKALDELVKSFMATE
ncbi:3-deoxy-8-phosphooctulonate synthase [Mesorhizobium sp.]|uniref:3-deoxy-8-phosphooctulonate synthase n=1 Tax=Mesorhizobium sp. TaxID=1871066 RepID=UPI000FE4A71D|nr:3-deoxy-8-phosphooctulonate synthase [Mesorhizobium sp.]RWE31174.1 MAG: 3-deoxy-8-phosphooctulonate synthase [Mesorhizobium sp.]